MLYLLQRETQFPKRSFIEFGEHSAGICLSKNKKTKQKQNKTTPPFQKKNRKKNTKQTNIKKTHIEKKNNKRKQKKQQKKTKK